MLLDFLIKNTFYCVRDIFEKTNKASQNVQTKIVLEWLIISMYDQFTGSSYDLDIVTQLHGIVYNKPENLQAATENNR